MLFVKIDVTISGLSIAYKTWTLSICNCFKTAFNANELDSYTCPWLQWRTRLLKFITRNDDAY